MKQKYGDHQPSDAVFSLKSTVTSSWDDCVSSGRMLAVETSRVTPEELRVRAGATSGALTLLERRSSEVNIVKQTESPTSHLSEGSQRFVSFSHVNLRPFTT